MDDHGVELSLINASYDAEFEAQLKERRLKDVDETPRVQRTSP